MIFFATVTPFLPFFNRFPAHFTENYDFFMPFFVFSFDKHTNIR